MLTRQNTIILSILRRGWFPLVHVFIYQERQIIQSWTASKGFTDVFMIAETKLDDSFPGGHLFMDR